MLSKTVNGAIATFTSLALLSISALTFAQTSRTQTIFYVSTSGRNGNVNYSIQLNPDCSPAGNQPVSTYYKNQDGSTRPLNQLEQEGYSISSQSVAGNTINVALGTLQQHGIEKPITITSSRLMNGTCQTGAITSINGTPTQLAYAYVEVNRRQILGQTVGLQVLNISLVGVNQQSETIVCSSNCQYGF